MNLTTLITVIFYYITCTFGFDNELQEREYYLTKVNHQADLDYGHGELNDKRNLAKMFKEMTLGDLKVTSVELYSTLECSYLLNLHYHITIFQSYLLLKTKPNLSADEIEKYSFVKEVQRMLTAMHNVDNFSTFKYIMWMYLLYTEKIADIMRHPEKVSSVEKILEKSPIGATFFSMNMLIEHSIRTPLCRYLSYKREEVFSGWPIYERNSMDYHAWAIKLTNVRNIVLKQLDFNDSKGFESMEDNTYSLDVLHLKGVFDQPDQINYLIRKLLVNSNWNEIKFKSQGLSILPENVDCNSLAISSASFKELQEKIQTDYYPTLSQQINHLVKFHTNFIQFLKVIPLQLINKYLLTIISSIPYNSYIEHRIPTILNFCKEIADQLSVLVDILDLEHDDSIPGMIQFFNEISNNGQLSLSIVSDTQNSLNTNLEEIGKQLFDGPIINKITFEADSISAGSIVETEDGSTEKLRALVNDIKEITEYIKENITIFVNFKGIHSFIDIEFSEEYSKQRGDEETVLP